MNGRRVYPNADGWLTEPFEPGDYGRALPTRNADGSEPDPFTRRGWWQVRAPNGHSGCLNPEIHTVTEHHDGSITVHPSIVINGPDGRELYHGWLKAGVWSNA